MGENVGIKSRDAQCYRQDTKGADLLKARLTVDFKKNHIQL